MDEAEGAVLRLRADGLSYRQIAAQLGLPLTRVFKLAQQAVGPDPSASGEPSPVETAPEPPPSGYGDTPRAVPPGYLTGPYRMPTRDDVAQGYTMPGPGGTVFVVGGR